MLAQLGNRVQHALRAFTPRDQKAVKAAADTMRANPKLGDMASAITELAVGEALVSFLDEKGRPSVTERVFVLPPGSQIGPITPDQRKALIDGSLVAGVYEKMVDRESAYEKLKGRAAASGAAAAQGGRTMADEANTAARGGPGTPRQRTARRRGGMLGGLKDVLFGSHRPARRPPRGPGRVGRALGGALDRLVGGPRDHPRRAGQHPRRQPQALSVLRSRGAAATMRAT